MEDLVRRLENPSSAIEELESGQPLMGPGTWNYLELLRERHKLFWPPRPIRGTEFQRQHRSGKSNEVVLVSPYHQILYLDAVIKQ